MGRTRQLGNGVSGKIIEYLQCHQGKAVIDGVALGKKLGRTGSAVSYALHKLVKEGVIKALGPTGKGHKNIEFQLIKDVNLDGVEKNGVEEKPRIKTRDHNDNKGNLELKLSISRELVQVYEELRKTQDLATSLQAENAKLNRRIVELEAELESEKSFHHHEANEIAQLELQLRELRAESTKGARRLLFDQRGVQA